MKLHFVNEINQRLHDMIIWKETDISEVESSFVNDIIDKIKDICIESAKNSFGKHQTKVKKKQPWFTKECKNAIDSVIENIDDYTKSMVKAYSKKSCKERKSF